MPRTYLAPTVAYSFNCPHCGALAHQAWFKAYVIAYRNGELPITDIADDFADKVQTELTLDAEAKSSLIEHFTKVRTREPFFPLTKDEGHAGRLSNVDFTRCFGCKKFAVWVGGKVVFPDFTHEIMPSDDLPPEIKADFVEAQAILNRSPRGSAALLRLCVQKLCIHLGDCGCSYYAAPFNCWTV